MMIFVAPINLISSSLFRQVECEVNGYQVSDLTSPTYQNKQVLYSKIYKRRINRLFLSRNSWSYFLSIFKFSNSDKKKSNPS